MSRLNLMLLGSFQVRPRVGPPLAVRARKARSLLAYLALAPGHAHAREKLADLLAPEAAPDRARNALRRTIFELRRVLPDTRPPIVLVHADTIALNAEAVEVDAVTFDQLAARGTDDALERAAALYRGDFLEGFTPLEGTFEEWLVAQRARLRERMVQIMTELLSRQTKRGDASRAIQTAFRLLELDPLQEPVHRALMQLYDGQGRRALALRQYQVCVETLQRELGVEPEAESRELYRQVLSRQDRRPSAGGRGERAPRRSPGLAVSLAVPAQLTVGRARERERLRQALSDSRRSRGRAVMIVGEAGIGKTHLVHDLLAESVEHGCVVLLGRSYPSEQVLPFGPWIDALRAARVVEDHEAVQRLDPTFRAELSRLIPELRTAGVRPERDAPDARNLFEAMARLLEGLASERPLTLVLEDLQWADEMSLRLLAFVVRRLAGRAVLTVATARADEVPLAPRLQETLEELTRESHVAIAELAPLSRADSEALVRALVGRARSSPETAHLVEQAWRMSEGHPFTIVESLRMLREGSAVDPFAKLPMPERVSEVILRRLARLDERSRHLVAVAAVIGRECDFELLRRGAGLAAGEAAAGVEELVRRRVLRSIGDRLDFVHDRVREVAYGSLLGPRQRLLHGEVARTMEALYAARLDQHHAALGAHWIEAEAWDKAVEHLRRAGVMARMACAYGEARAFFERALAALAHLAPDRHTLERSIDLRLELRFALLPLREIRRVLDVLREAERLAGAIDDRERLAHVSSFFAHGHFLVGAYDECIAAGRSALAAAVELGEVDLELTSRLVLGQALHALGRYREAADLLGQVAGALQGEWAARQFGMPGLPSVVSRAWLAWCLAELGEFDRGLAIAEDAFRIAASAGHSFSLVHAGFGLGNLHFHRGNLDEAVAILEQAVRLSREKGFTLMLSLLEGALGSAYARSGRAAEAVDLLGRVAGDSARTDLKAYQSLRVARLGEAHLLGGDHQAAAEHAARAFDLAREYREHGHAAWIGWLLGEIDARRAPPEVEAAEAWYRLALTEAQDLGMRPLMAHCHRGFAALYRRSGRLSEGEEHLTAAATLSREMDMPLGLEPRDGG